MKFAPKGLGPTFESELYAAGFPRSSALTWGPDADFGNVDLLTPEQQQILQRVYSANDPLGRSPAAAAPITITDQDAHRFIGQQYPSMLPGSIGGVSGGEGVGPAPAPDVAISDDPGAPGFTDGLAGTPSSSFSISPSAAGTAGKAVGSTAFSLGAAAIPGAGPFLSMPAGMLGAMLGEAAGSKIADALNSLGISGSLGASGRGPAIGANDPGFSTSPLSTGTPFSSNPVPRGQETNFGRRQTVTQNDPDPTPSPTPTDVTPQGAEPSGGPGGPPGAPTAPDAQTGVEGMTNDADAGGTGGSGGSGPSGGPSGDGGPSSGDYARGGLVNRGHRPSAAWQNVRKFGDGGPVLYGRGGAVPPTPESERAARARRVREFEMRYARTPV